MNDSKKKHSCTGNYIFSRSMVHCTISSSLSLANMHSSMHFHYVRLRDPQMSNVFMWVIVIFRNIAYWSILFECIICLCTFFLCMHALHSRPNYDVVNKILPIIQSVVYAIYFKYSLKQIALKVCCSRSRNHP